MIVDKRLMKVLSSEDVDSLIRQANKLAPNEGKVVTLTIGEWRYPIALTSTEVTGFPL